MKKLILYFVALFSFTFLPPVTSQAQQAVSIDFFYDSLDPYGNWLEVGEYGYVWQPRDVPADWRPYSNGRWIHTDAGWTWDSTEPFAWAVYHYGRWVDIENVGWVWVPDTEWGPAWVSWRSNPRYTGWAPLPPEARFRESVGFESWVDDYYDIGPRSYHFVENRDFGARNLDLVLVDPRRNLRLIEETNNITNIRYVNDSIYNGGPSYDELTNYSESPIPHYRIERREWVEGNVREQRPDQFKSTRVGDLLRVFAVPFVSRSTSAPPPRRLTRRIERVEVDRGWKDIGPIAEVERLRTKIKEKSKRPDNLPQQPKFDKSDNDEPRNRMERKGKDRDSNQRDNQKSDKPKVVKQGPPVPPPGANNPGRVTDPEQGGPRNPREMEGRPGRIPGNDPSPNNAGRPDRDDKPTKPNKEDNRGKDNKDNSKREDKDKDKENKPEKQGKDNQGEKRDNKAKPDKEDKPDRPSAPSAPGAPPNAPAAIPRAPGPAAAIQNGNGPGPAPGNPPAARAEKKDKNDDKNDDKKQGKDKDKDNDNERDKKKDKKSD